MRAMIVKEFRQLRRDRRTLAMLIAMPVLLLVIFGYAARFDISDIHTAVYGPQAAQVAAALQTPFDVVITDPAGDAATAEEALRRSEASVAIVAASTPQVFVDGSDLFTAQSALRQAPRIPGNVTPTVLFNPDLSTAVVMVPALIGLILAFIGTIVTSLGVVRERQDGTLEQLAVMPLRPRDVITGKIAPYFLVGTIDMALITAAGLLIFDVPFEGSPLLFALVTLLFLFVVLGLGVLISTVSRTTGEAIQLAVMVMLPQVLLSGMIFPLTSMAAGVRWIGYLLPLTYFVMAARGIFLRDAPFGVLALPIGALALMAVIVFGAAIVRFRRDLAPGESRSAPGAP